MTNQVREHQCPNCGAPLGIPHQHERFFKCQFCGTVLEDRASREEQETGVFNIKISRADIDAAQHARLQTYAAPPVITTYSTGSPTVTTSRAGCIITLIIFLFVGGILAVTALPPLIATGALVAVFETLGIDSGEVPFVENNGLGGLQIYSFGSAATLPSDNDTTPDFIGVARAADETNRLIYVDLENDPAMRWMVEISDEDAVNTYNQYIADSSRVYLSLGSSILAFNRQQGTQLWAAALDDEIQHVICPGCFQLIGDRIVTLSAGGALEAWNTADGSRAWSIQLNESPRQIVNFGGNPGVLDQLDGSTTFNVYAIADGSQVQQLAPACPNEPFPNDPQEVQIYDPMLASPDNNGVFFFAGIFDPGCTIFWRPGSSQPEWLTTYPVDITRSFELANLVLSEDTLFFAVDKGIYAIDRATGAFRVLTENEDYNFTGIGARDGVVVVQAERTRGTRRWEIWGVDAGLGNVKWTFLPEAEDFFDYVSHPLFAEGAWVAGLTPGGLTVAQMYDEAPRVVFQTIPLQSGTASEPVTYHFGGGIGGHWVSVLDWRSDQFWVLESTDLHVINVSSGEAEGRWP